MRKFLPVLIGTFLLFSPHVATAAGVSTYAQRVLERAAAAENAALSGEENGGSNFFSFFWSWMENINTSIFQTVDTRMMITVQQEDLPRTTACLHTDFILILKEMEKVRSLLMQAHEQSDTSAIMKLTDLYEFLHQRLTILERGNMDPSYKDPTWSMIHNFDPDTDATTMFENEDLCPFSTKYFSISVDQVYGCTPAVMDEILSSLPSDPDMSALRDTVTKEKDALSTFLESLDRLRSQTAGSQPPPTPPSPPPQLDGCIGAWPQDLRTWSSGNFWKMPGQKFLLLRKLLQHLEPLREIPEEFTNPFGFLGFELIRQEIERELKVFSEAQTAGNSIVVGGILYAQDMEDAFSPLSETIGKLSRLTHDIDKPDEKSLRDYVRDFNYFLRRSCMNRTCNASLERTLKIVTTDACFPYTEAEETIGTTQEEIDELTQACEDAAGVDLE